jgi:hypothetical protein
MQNPRRFHSIAVFLLAATPCFAVTVSRGPFLQLQTPTSIHVVWWTDEACTGDVQWGTTSSYGQVASSTESVTRHEIEISGLTANTLYHYRVLAAGTALTSDTTFRTAPAAGSSAVTFAFVGDSCSAPANAKNTYNAMLSHSPNGFCITLGDLAGRGEDNLTDYWQSHFFTPAASFIKQICMFPCVGNHEIYDEDSFPDYVYPTKYLANWSLPTDSGSELYYSFDRGPVHFAALDTWWSSYTTGTTQYNWLANDLAATSQAWKIVYAHNGPYVSQGGDSDGSSVVRTNLVPLLEQRGVDLYLFGHYHEYERNLVDGVTYIDQGTGGQSLGGVADDSQTYVQAYAASQYCFTRIDVQGSRLLGRCIRTSDGAILDGWELDKPKIGMPWQDSVPATGTQLNWTTPWSYTTQCGVVASAGNPSGDGYALAVADSSGHQFAYPMLASQALTDYSIQARVLYDATSSVQTRYGIGLRGRQFFASDLRSCYALFFVRNDSLAANGTCVLVRQNAGTETVLASWEGTDVTGWHRLKLAASGVELSVWIDDELKGTVSISTDTLTKGRPFIYNYRASSAGSKTLADDVLIDEVVSATTITDFESYSAGVQAMFRQPSFSSSTSSDITATPNSSEVAAVSALGGAKVCQIDWAYVDTDPQRWLRLSTSGTANVPNPTVDLNRPITFWYRLTTAGSLRVCLGIRETGTAVAIGANGGTSGTIEWLGADSVVNGAPQGKLITYNAAGDWQKITFDPLTDPVRAFTGDGVLSAANHKGVIEHVALAVVDAAGPLSLQMDLFAQPFRDAPTSPTITVHPTLQMSCPGGTVSFSVTATGSSPLTYQWQKNGTNLAEGGVYSGTNSGILSISNAQAAQEGDYRCVVSNTAGNATSQSASFTLRPVTQVTSQPQAKTAYAGDTVVLSLAATGGGTLTYRWQKDGVDLPAGSGYTGETTATLTFASASVADSGTYRCMVTGTCGTATTNDAALTVLAAYVGDFDHDNDVDQEDFSFLQLCLNRQSDAACADANLDDLTEIGQGDVLVFLDCLSGPNETPPASCAK